MSEPTRNQALGAHAAKEIDTIEAKFPKPARSREEVIGILTGIQAKTIAALRAKPGVDSHNKVVFKLKREAAYCLRAIKDLSALLPPPGE